MSIIKKQIFEINFLSFWIYFSIYCSITFFVVDYFYYLALLLGIFNIIIFIYYYQKLYFSKKWVKTEGLYKKYYLENVRFIIFSHYSGYHYRPYCLYMYEVDGKTYKNDRLCILNKDFLTHEQFKKNAHYIVGKNSRTKEVDVYYNPKKPNESILVKGASSSKMIVLYSMFAIGLISLVIGLYNCPCV